MRVNLLNRIVKFFSLIFFLSLIYKTSYPFNPDIPANLYLKFSPLLNFQISLHSKNVSYLVVPLIIIFFTFISGRFFCGWICPLGSLFTLFEEIFLKRIKRFKINIYTLKYYILFFTGLSIFTYFPLTGVLDPLCIITRETNYIFTKKIPFFLIFLIFLSFVSPFFWCKNLCPLGALFSIFSSRSLFKLNISEKCIKCKNCENICPTSAIDEKKFFIKNSECILCFDCYEKCNKEAVKFTIKNKKERSGQKNVLITRRNFLNLLFFSGIYFLFYEFVKLNYKPSYLLRPPGALKEEKFLNKCIRCLKCVKICPTKTLTPCGLEDGIFLVYTPKFVPVLGGCELCMLCTKICPSSALVQSSPEDVKIGTAVIEKKRCLAWSKNKLCLICMEVCAFGAISSYKIYPVVDKIKCVGCGVCEKNCPVEKKAIFVTPEGAKRQA